MKHNIILIISLLFIFGVNALQAKRDDGKLQLPSYIVNGDTVSINPLEIGKKGCVDKNLSAYIENKLPVMKYDGSQFHFIIKLTINKSGYVKRVVFDKNDFPQVTKDIKRILSELTFEPACLNGKKIKYTGMLYILIDFH